MLIGEAIFFVWVGGLLLLGFLGFFVMALVLSMRVFGFVMRGVFGARRDEPAGAALPSFLCRQPGCGFSNVSGARFCARCGRPLFNERRDRHG